MKNSQHFVDRSPEKKVRKEIISSGKLEPSEVGTSGNMSQTQGRDIGYVSTSTQKISVVSLPRNLLRKSIAPLLSLKISKSSASDFLAFLVKVAALEALRRGSQAKCPQIWWGLQGISLFQAPPFSWFVRWAPLRLLVQGTQIFSKPMIFLSIATAVSTAIKETRQGDGPALLKSVLGSIEPGSDVREHETDRRIESLNLLKEELVKGGVDWPERINDDELERFLVAANGSVPRFVAGVQKAVSWRRTYYFLNSQELQEWSDLVFWHSSDAFSRPTLVIRLGCAYTTIEANDRPRFCQAVVSQVEYGVLHLLNPEDPRITVIMDCEGTSAIGFPVNMMKSCSVLVQEHFPTRLAALFAINLPPVVRVVANAVMQVVRPVTREKIWLLSDVFMGSLAEHMGGSEKVPAAIGGACHCYLCLKEHQTADAESPSLGTRVLGSYGYVEGDEEERGNGDQTSDYQSYNQVLRMAIVGFLMLWIVLALVAGSQQPHFPSS